MLEIVAVLRAHCSVAYIELKVKYCGNS